MQFHRCLLTIHHVSIISTHIPLPNILYTNLFSVSVSFIPLLHNKKIMNFLKQTRRKRHNNDIYQSSDELKSLIDHQFYRGHEALIADRISQLHLNYFGNYSKTINTHKNKIKHSNADNITLLQYYSLVYTSTLSSGDIVLD